MIDYRKVDATHHLSSYQVMLPIWNGTPPVWKPFEVWEPLRGRPRQGKIGLPWYEAYNASKHDRHDEFKKANLENLVQAVAGLLVLLSAQFGSNEFGAGAVGLGISGEDYHPLEPAIGSLFRVGYPTDWGDAELYDFDWSVLKTQTDRFQKIDYDAIPY